MNTTDTEENKIKEFLEEKNINLSRKYLGKLYPIWDDKNEHDVWSITFSRKDRLNGKCHFQVLFYQSLESSSNIGKKSPTRIEIFSALNTQVFSDFFEFCNMLGYSLTDKYGNRNENSYEIYQLANSEARKVNKFFSSEELSALQDMI